MRRLRARPAATADVEESAFFYALEAGPELGERFRQAVERTYAWILENPHSGSPRSRINPRLEGLRMRPVSGFEQHLVFYLPSEEEVEVVRVLHGARDILGILREE